MEEIMDAWASWLVGMFMFLSLVYCILDWCKMGREDQRREPVNVIASQDAQLPEPPAPRELRQRYPGDTQDLGREVDGNQGGDEQNGDGNGDENGNGSRNANRNGDGNGDGNGSRNGNRLWIITVLAFYVWVWVFHISFLRLLSHLKIRSFTNETTIHK